MAKHHINTWKIKGFEDGRVITWREINPEILCMNNRFERELKGCPMGNPQSKQDLEEELIRFHQRGYSIYKNGLLINL